MFAIQTGSGSHPRDNSSQSIRRRPASKRKEAEPCCAQSLPAYYVNHNPGFVRSPYVVENVPPRLTLHLCGQLERLRRDPLNTGIKIGSNEICEFQARFVDDMVTKGR